MSQRQAQPDPPGGAQGEPSLGWLLAALGQRAASGFRIVIPDGVHPRQFAVLHTLHTLQSARGADGALSQRALADVLAIPPGRLVPLIDDLENRGWVRRVPDAHDRRANLLTLTADGGAAAASLALVARRYDESIAGDLSAEERRQLLALLGRLSLPGGGSALVW